MATTNSEALLRLRLQATNEANPAFQEAIDAMKSMADEATTASKSVSDSIDEMVKSFTSIRQAITGSSETADKSLESLSLTTKDVAKSVEESMAALEKGVSGIQTPIDEAVKGVSTAMDDLQKVMVDAAKSASADTAEMRNSFVSLEQGMSAVVMSIRAQTREISASMTAMSDKSSAAGEKLSRSIDYAGLLIAGEQLKQFSDAILGFFEKSVEAGVDFSQTMANTRAALDSQPGAIKASNDEMQKMQDLALQIGSTGFFSANQVGEAMSTLAKNGTHASQIMNGAIQQTANVAAANQQDIDETAMTVSDIFNELGNNIVKQFHGNVSSAFQYIGDVMTQTLHASKISMNDFFNTMKYAGSVASNAGMSFGDLGGAIALLGSHAIRGSQAGTTLRRMLTNLTPASAAAQTEMQKLGMITSNGTNIFYNANGTLKSMTTIQSLLHDKLASLSPQMETFALKTIFGQYALNGMSIIANETPGAFAKLEDSMNKTGATMTALDDRSQGWAYTWMRLQAEFQTIQKEIGLMLKPAIDVLSNALGTLMNWWDRLGKSAQMVIVSFVGVLGVLAAVAAGILTFVGTVGFLVQGLGAAVDAFTKIGAAITDFSKVGSLFSLVTNPWLLLIAAVVAGVVLVIANWNQINAWVTQHFGASIPQILQQLGQVFSQVWNAIRNVIQTVWNYIQPTLISGMQTVENYWKQIWPEIQQVFTEVWNVMKPIVEVVFALWKGLFQADLGILKGVWDVVWAALGATLKMTWDLFKNIIQTDWDLISGIFKVMLDLLTGQWGKAWDDMKSTLQNVWNDIKQLFSQFAQDAENFGKSIIQGLAKGIEDAAGAVISAAQGVISSIKSIFTGGTSAAASAASSATTGGGVKGVSSSVPHFAEGGVVTQPTLAMVGEGGEEEYIVPKSKLQQTGGYQIGLPSSMPMSAQNNAAQQRPVNIYLTVNSAGKDGQSIGSDIVGVLKANMKFAV
ncbi:phage tail tape measure protein [Alicyclobacillus fastidiosus]|uniref:Phage tail tape measure protein n=1 Tax=Alicyclobacillus fastidiosus TaxID=392011 RepID=A0ABV5AIH6_9BACL|nr:phage tail tape measure protein [Alicyclobacillus fastidiosus]WEH11142.1 phage tail tape measure protein [Alicyclobacillus fastidiosus]